MKNWQIGIIIFSILLIGLFIIPSYKNGNVLKQKNNFLQQELSIKIKELKKLDSNQSDFSATEASLYDKVPEEVLQEQIIRNINEILKKYSFDLQGGINFSKGFNSEINVSEIRSTFAVIGPKNNLNAFVSAFEKNKRFFSIEKLNVQIFSENGRKMVSLPISLLSFFQ